MAYYTNLIALRIIKGKYVVESFVTANLNVRLLEEDHVLNDVSENNFYLDQAAIIQKEKFVKYLDDSPSNFSSQKWFRDLSKDVKLIIIHKLEWESGFCD